MMMTIYITTKTANIKKVIGQVQLILVSTLTIAIHGDVLLSNITFLILLFQSCDVATVDLTTYKTFKSVFFTVFTVLSFFETQCILSHVIFAIQTLVYLPQCFILLRCFMTHIQLALEHKNYISEKHKTLCAFGNIQVNQYDILHIQDEHKTDLRGMEHGKSTCSWRSRVAGTCA